MSYPRRRFLFLTSCPEAWGGSEELWSGVALGLHQRGHHVFVGRCVPMPRGREHRRWKHLRRAGLKVRDFGTSWLCYAVPGLLLQVIPGLLRPVWWLRNLVLGARLRWLSPDLVVISLGHSYDACYPLSLPEVCRFANVPYVLICQKASDLTWPSDGLRDLLRRCYQRATRTYFVSHHNCRTVEHQLALSLDRAEVVQNPFMVKVAEPLPWPAASEGTLRLACVARLWPLEKAQDVLLMVLAQEKWRNRPVRVSFFGEGPMADGLMEMAQMLKLNNVQFQGFGTPEEIWGTHHALVLPSRSEGLPLVQVEAMICGRPVIVTDAGGTSEIMRHGIHGFLAGSATVAALDQALEEAWKHRARWPAIGVSAASHIRQLYHHDPCECLGEQLSTLCNNLGAGK